MCNSPQFPIGLGTEISLYPSFVPRFLDLFLNHGNLLDSLYKGSKGTSVKRKERTKERESLLIESVKELTMPKSLFRDEKSFVALYVLERPCP